MTRSPARSCSKASIGSRASAVAYSGWEPTSRYSREPLVRYVFVERARDTTGWNIIIATCAASTGWSEPVTDTPYSVSTPKMRANPWNCEDLRASCQLP